MRYKAGNADVSPLIDRFVTTKGSVTPEGKPSRRYMKLLGGNFLRLPEPELVVFARSIARDAQEIADNELDALLLDGDWRPRLVAAYLIGLDRRTQFHRVLSDLLLESGGPYAGKGYCFALARLGGQKKPNLLSPTLIAIFLARSAATTSRGRWARSFTWTNASGPTMRLGSLTRVVYGSGHG